jgi:thiamine thiazole synthase
MLKEVDEAVVTRTIVKEFLDEFMEYTESDVIIVGSGPSGATAARYLAREGIKTLVLERQIMVGGGMWQGGMLFPKLVIESPAERILTGIGVKLKQVQDGVYVCSAHEAASKAIAAATDAGAKIFNSVELRDVIYRENGVNGVVVNWHAVRMLPDFVTCVDPLALKSKVVIDATGHSAEVARVCREKLGLKIPEPREGSMWASEAEKATIANTHEIYPGLIVCGMAANAVAGLPRMGPLYGAMFLSGIKAAQLASAKLNGGRPTIEVEQALAAELAIR